LVAPIALYPDELVSQILVASTYPLEVVQAYQWMQQHPELKGADLTKAAQGQNWDPSVQALTAFPDLLKRLNQDVTWLTNLGNAFLASQSQVMDAVQTMRQRAQDSGKLASTDKEKVTTTSENGQRVVVIEPANPEVVYVPDYDPIWVWGPAPVWYPYPYWYYPPAPPLGFWCWWGPRVVVSGVFIGWNGWAGWGWHPGWYHRTVVVNNTFITSNHFTVVHTNVVGGRNVWIHESVHRMGVAYPNRTLASHFRPAFGRPAAPHVTVEQARQQFHSSAQRVNTFHSFDRMGSRQINPGVYNHNRSAFGGIENGAAARAHSNRGFSSLGHTNTNGGSRTWGDSKDGGHGGWGGGGGRH
jgi:hypothetical protein